MKVSVLILTKNEEKNIKDCIISARQVTDDIIVLDSLSSDRTIEIAKSLNAKIITRNFDGWARHQNWAVQNISFRHRWVLYIDADERITKELADEIISIPTSIENVAYKIYRDNRFVNGEPLKYSMSCPGIIRLFKPEKIRYERDINPMTIVSGSVSTLNSRIIHFNFSKGLGEWIIKHIEYAKREASEMERSDSDAHFLKKLSYRFTYFRFPLRLFYQLFFKLGFLDGYAGIRYAILISFYEHLIEEFRRNG